MRINIICIGKLKESYLSHSVDDYFNRISHYTKLTIDQIKDEKIQGKASQAQLNIIKNKEGEKILLRTKSLTGHSFFPLSVDGESFTSEGFASLINHNPRCTFIIGGTLGLSKDVINLGRAISFSKLTFSHQIMRLILLEQIFRAYKIINNETYHK